MRFVSNLCPREIRRMKVTGGLRVSCKSTWSNMERGDHLGGRDAVVMVGPISQLIYDVAQHVVS